MILVLVLEISQKKILILESSCVLPERVMQESNFTRVTRTFTKKEMKALEAAYLPPEIKPKENKIQAKIKFITTPAAKTLILIQIGRAHV